MTRKRLIDILLVAAVGIVLTVCAFFVKPWVNADSVALIKSAHTDKPGDPEQAAAGSGLFTRCRSCTEKVVRQVGAGPGIAWVKKDPKNSLLIVAYDSRSVCPDTIAAGLTASGSASSIEGVMDIKDYCRGSCKKPGSSLLHKNSCGGYCRTAEDKGEKK